MNWEVIESVELKLEKYRDNSILAMSLSKIIAQMNKSWISASTGKYAHSKISFDKSVFQSLKLIRMN